MDFTLDPSAPKTWGVGGGTIFTTMDLGPLTELIGIRHGFHLGGRRDPRFEPEMVYPPALAPSSRSSSLARSSGSQRRGRGFQGSFRSRPS
jgi:hypothetical protein